MAAARETAATDQLPESSIHSFFATAYAGSAAAGGESGDAPSEPAPAAVAAGTARDGIGDATVQLSNRPTVQPSNCPTALA